jgi:hypothetical protein
MGKGWHATSNGRKHIIGRLWSRLAWAKNRDPIFKITRGKMSGGMAQVVDHLSYSGMKPYLQNPSTALPPKNLHQPKNKNGRDLVK